jgi:hypothetical protein
LKRRTISQQPQNIQELLTSENIFSSPEVAETFLYFVYTAGTAWVLQTELNQPEATVYEPQGLRPLVSSVPR